MNSLPKIAERPYLDAALQAAKWIDRARVATEHGCAWRDEMDSPALDPWPKGWSLYSGTSGIVLFLLEFYAATGNDSYLHLALSGADHLRATLPYESCSEDDVSLYYGIAGAAYALEQTYQVSGRPQDHEAAANCIAVIRRHADAANANQKPWGRGVELVGGRAGVGLMLLWWARETQDDSTIELAIQLGHAVVQRAKPYDSGGIYWNTGDSLPDLPGFAHGSAGTAYFLAALYERTHERVFLDTAIAAAHRLQQIAVKRDRGYLIPSMLKDNDKPVPMFFLAWCHGAIGICRLFFQLARVTNDPQWTDWVHRLAQGVMSSGVPEQREKLLPYCAIQCCGDAGVAQAFLDLHKVYGNVEYLDFCRRMNAWLIKDATVDETGMRWGFGASAAGPAYPPKTGFMSGAAGIGTWLLNLDGFEQQRPALVTLPDTPF